MPGDPITGEILVNSTSTSEQRWPSVTYLENGGFVVVWRDDSQSGGDSSGSAIRAQVHDAFGNPVGAELLINANTGANQEDPAVSAVSGGFVVTWVDSSGVGGDSSASSIKARIFTSDGTAVGDEFLVNTETANHQIQPAITVLADGRFVISWADESAIGTDTSSYGIKARIFGSDGSPLGGEFLVNSSTAGAQVQPTIAALADGGFAIAWMSATGGGYDVRAQVYDAAGNATGGELVVNTSVTGGHAEPGIAGLSGGGFVVAWAAAANGDSDVYGVQARVFDGAGNALTDEFLVNANIAGEQSQPVATGLADGTFVISFVDGFPGFAYEIKAQQFSPDGSAVGTEIHVNTVSAGSQIRPAIATLAGGDFVISWMDDSSGWEIKARVYDGPDASSAPAEAHMDEFTTNELGIVTGNVFADNGFGADSDPDGPALSVAAVNGDPDAVGTQIVLPSGALLTLNADGSFIYDPNGAFEQTPTYGSGAMNTPSSDFFSYALVGGDSTIVVFTINGIDNNDVIVGSLENDLLTGGVGNDLIFGDEGNDHLRGNFGNDDLDGGDGFDRVGYFNGATSGVAVDLRISGPQDVGEQGFDTITDVEAVSGTPFADTLTGNDEDNWLWGSISDGGTANNDYLDGQGGNDLLTVGTGNHTIIGGDGNDTLRFTENGNPEVGITVDLFAQGGPQDTGAGSWTISGIENVSGSVENDDLGGDGNANILAGSLGNDVLFGFGGNDTLYGDGAIYVDNQLILRTVVDAGSEGGNDQLFGGGGNDMMYGGAGNDFLQGQAGNDSLYGGAGNDYVGGGQGDDLLDGGDGWDRASFANGATGPVTVDLRIQGVAQDTGLGMDTLVGIENANGTSFADTFIGNDEDNWLWGGNDAPGTGDTIDGQGGNDLIEDGVGDHILSGGDGIDTFSFNPFTTPTNATISLALQGAAQDTGAGIMTLSGFENLSGSSFSDTLIGDGNDNTLAGGELGDILVGGAGNDTLYGDGFFGTSSSPSGQITLFTDVGSLGGVDGDDTLEGGLGDDLIDGGGGSDTASYEHALGGVTAFLYRFDNGNGESFGADGVDTLANIENLTGSAFNDILYGDDANNVVSGGDGHDDVRGFGGDDQIYGGAGDDLLYGNAGTDLLDGGDGIDRVGYYSGATAGVTVDLRLQGVAQDTGQGWDTLLGIENVSGTQFGDTLIGDVGDNVLWGSASTISPGNIATGNNDTLIGNGGNDLLIAGIGNHTIDGGDGIDTFRFNENGAPETGITLSLLIAGAQATANGTWTLTGIENLSGSIADDSLTGDGNANVLAGDLGNDTLVGGAGNDTLYGDGQIVWDGHGTGRSGPIITYVDATGNYVGGVAGNDLLEGGVGNDTLDGGGGIDTASYEHASGGVTVNLGTGFATGADGTDSLVNIENLIGSGFNDSLTGSGGANAIYGLAGNDTISGGAGDDLIDGGDGDDFLQGDLSETNLTAVGNDTIYGGNGNDNLRGGLGNDVMYGGGNNDLFRGNGGVDSFDGGADDGEGFNGIGDRVSFFEQRATQGVVADLRTGIISNDGFGNVETMVGIESLGGDTAFVDTFYGNDGRNYLAGNRGDYLYGFGGNDLIGMNSAAAVIDGGDGTDRLSLFSSGFWLTPDTNGDGIAETAAAATAGWNVDLSAGTITDGYGNVGTVSGIENVDGNFMNDTLVGDSNANVFNGFDGDDILEGRGGDDGLDGGMGTDTASYANASGAVTVTLGADGSGTSTGADGTDTLVSIENLLGGAFNDNLTGNGAANTLDGGGGHDRLNGGGGDDWLLGGTGDDTHTGGGGDDLIDGGAGYDRAAYFGATSGVTVNLAIAGAQNTGGAGSDTLVGIENLTGTQYSDTLTGDSGDNWLWGFATTAGTVNNDTLNGGGGNDLLWVGNGNMTLIGGSGNDTVMYNQNFSGDVAVTISLATAAAQNTGQGTWTLSGIENLVGGNANDTLTGDNNANILCGAAGTDTLNGGTGNDTLYGDGTITFDDHGTGGSGPIILVGNAIPIYGGVAGNDNLNGGDGDDFLYGGGGNDFLKGDKDNDTLYGGTGNDTLVGGAGNDRYVIEANSGADTISGFTHVDRIVFDVASGVTSFSQLTMTAVGGTNTLITWGNGNSILVQGLRPRDMVASDFQFTTAAGFEHTPHDFATSWSVPHDPFL